MRPLIIPCALVSVLVIVGVNLASEFSTVAAAIATAPTGTPVSIWVMVQQNPQKKATILIEYTNNVVKGVLATLAFALGCNATARSGYGMWPVLAVGYLTWFLAWTILSRL